MLIRPILLTSKIVYFSINLKIKVMIKNSLLALGFILLMFGNPFGILLLIPASIIHLRNEIPQPQERDSNLIIDPYI
jgi:hypothetical protein